MIPSQVPPAPGRERDGRVHLRHEQHPLPRLLLERLQHHPDCGPHYARLQVLTRAKDHDSATMVLMVLSMRCLTLRFRIVPFPTLCSSQGYDCPPLYCRFST